MYEHDKNEYDVCAFACPWVVMCRAFQGGMWRSEDTAGVYLYPPSYLRHALLLSFTAYTRPSGLWAPGYLRCHHRSDYRHVTASGFVWVWRSKPWCSCLQVKDFSLWAVSSVCGCYLRWCLGQDHIGINVTRSEERALRSGGKRD